MKTEKNQLKKEIASYLYVFMGGKEAGLPPDEYDVEASMVVDRILEAQELVSDDEVAEIIREVFSRMFDNDYDQDVFLKAGQDIGKIVQR